MIDASVALAWCFPDEASDFAHAVLEALEHQEVMAPRFGRSRLQTHYSPAEALANVLPLAREYDLSACDAAYLDVAVCHEIPLATLNDTFRKAAHAVGV